MLSKSKQVIVAVLTVALAGLVLPVWAQRPYRVNDRQVERTIERLETRTDIFRQSLDEALDRSHLNGTSTEDTINSYVRDFEQATNTLRDRFRDRRAVSSDVQEVLNRAAFIENFMHQHRLDPRTERDWRLLRADLDRLAQYYNVAWNWNPRPGNAAGGNYDGAQAGRYTGADYNGTLTGTYRLNQARSESADSVAERVTRNLSAAERQRVREAIIRRLEAPEMIAIDQRGRNFTIVSTLAPQITFEADGRDQTESLGDNRRVNVRASMSGDQLIVSTNGYRGSDFQVTFDPINYGRELRVTRRVYIDQLREPVIAISNYDRTSDIAQLNLYTGSQVGYNRGTSNNSGTMAGRAGRFYIPDGTQLIATLNDNITTANSKEGDRFTLTVRSPGEYAGAVIEGYIGSVDRAGRISGRSELALNFERIRLTNGQTYDFAGYIEDVRTPGGERVEVNNEGTVKKDDSQTSKTVTRAGIGAAVGALIGAIAGGGKGAAIGAAVGAGAGAGSVLIQGREDLELRSGSEFTVRASAPRR